MTTDSHTTLAPGQPPPLQVRILVVDDNPGIHEDFRKILCPTRDTSFLLKSAEATLFPEAVDGGVETKFEVDSAFQGREALAKVLHAQQEGRPYVLAFVDVRMPPGWDGVETIERLWQVEPELQVVICTAYADYSWETLSRRFRATDNLLILKKPFDSLEVLQLAHALSTKWRLSRQARMRIEDLDRAVAERTAELRLSEERFSRAFHSSPLPLALQTASDRRFFDVNSALLEMLGYARQEVLGRTPAELALFVEAEAAARLDEAIRQRTSLRNLDCQFRTRSGGRRVIVLSAEPLGVAKEQYQLLLAQDVTEQRQMQARLLEAKKKEAIGQLAAGVAHDFNNILTIITAQAQLALARPDLNPEVAEALHVIDASAKRAGALTKQLLAFGSKQLFRPQPLELSQLLRENEPMLRAALGESVRLSIECAPGLPCVLADPPALTHVVLQLALNARDAMPEGGSFTLRAAAVRFEPGQPLARPDARPGEFVCLSATDTGGGMDAATQARLFEPYFTTKEVGRGSGLGLASAHGILRQHGGWIEVSSAPGSGTTFRVFLPASVRVAEAAASAAPAAPPTTQAGSVDVLRGKTVLLVEDEDALRPVAERMLKRLGCRVLAAANGEAALALWQAHRGEIDLLLTDLVMPGRLDGKALAARLKADRPDLPVVYCSGYSADFQDANLNLREGVNFLPKPYSPRNLETILGRALAGPRT